MVITCKEATKYIVKKEEGKMTPRQRYRLWRHLSTCSLCRLFRLQNGFISNSLMQSHQNKKLDRADKEEIIKAMDKIRKLEN